jgi:hypothetical protein
LARALPWIVAPLLTVLFTSRSGRRAGGIVAEQLKLMGLSGLALVFGAACLFVLRTFCLKLLGRNTPEAAAMICQFSITMVFVGLLQALAFWALASRWSKISLLYGALGLGYWLTLFVVGQTPAALLQTMPVAAGLAFGALLLVWLHRDVWRQTSGQTTSDRQTRIKALMLDRFIRRSLRVCKRQNHPSKP